MRPQAPNIIDRLALLAAWGLVVLIAFELFGVHRFDNTCLGIGNSCALWEASHPGFLPPLWFWPVLFVAGAMVILRRSRRRR